jgi:hypothetical protein
MENTIIKNISFEKAESDPNEFYHSRPGISASGLKLLKKSPAHYKESQEAPKVQSDAMAFGEMYHTFILENGRFYKDYTVVDPEQRPDQDHSMTAKKNAAWLAEFENPVMKETHDQLNAMRRVLLSHPYARALLKAGEVEHSYYCKLDIGAKDPLSVRFRPDNVRHDKRIIVDLKTAADASADGFKKAAANFNYQIQAALYADLMELVMNEPLGYDFFFIAQEKAAPYAFNIFQGSPQFMSVGRYEYEILLMLYAHCLESDKWPGYQVFCQNKFGVNELNLPAWAVKELEYFTHKL